MIMALEDETTTPAADPAAIRQLLNQPELDVPRRTGDRQWGWRGLSADHAPATGPGDRGGARNGEPGPDQAAPPEPAANRAQSARVQSGDAAGIRLAAGAGCGPSGRRASRLDPF